MLQLMIDSTKLMFPDNAKIACVSPLNKHTYVKYSVNLLSTCFNYIFKNL